MNTKARAAAILVNAGFEEISDIIEALDAGHAFADEATLAEIDRLADEIERRALASEQWWIARARELATAVRKLGIGGGK